jgi:Secretion system C-terminal sorting domain
MKIKIILVLLFFCASVSAQNIKFYKSYSDNGYDYGNGICQLPDSSYVFTGGSSSFGDGASNAYLAKIDSLGNHKWAKSYGGPETDWGKRVKLIPNVGFYIAGVTNSFGAGGYDFMLIKTDLQGNEIWKKTFGGSNWENLHDATLTADNGMILVGESQSFGTGTNMYVVRTDVNGDLVWQKNYGGSGQDIAFAVEQWSMDTLMVAGQMFVADSNKIKPFLLAINMAGDSLWSKPYGTTAGIIYDIDKNGTELNLVGTTISSATLSFPLIVSISRNLQLIRSYIEGGNNQNAYRGITHYGPLNKNFLQFHTNTSGVNPYPIDRDLLISAINEYTYYENSVSYSDIGDDMPGQIIPTSDGGGMSISSKTKGIGGSNVILIKIGKNANFPSNVNQPNTSLVFLTNQEIIDLITVYPNPFTDELTIAQPFAGNYKIFDNAGKIVLEGDLNYTKKVLATELISGIYFLQIITPNKINTIKILKK